MLINTEYKNLKPLEINQGMLLGIISKKERNSQAPKTLRRNKLSV